MDLNLLPRYKIVTVVDELVQSYDIEVEDVLDAISVSHPDIRDLYYTKLTDIPPEILLNIASNLDIDSFFSLCATNVAMSGMCKDKYFLKNLLGIDVVTKIQGAFLYRTREMSEENEDVFFNTFYANLIDSPYEPVLVSARILNDIKEKLILGRPRKSGGYSKYYTKGELVVFGGEMGIHVKTGSFRSSNESITRRLLNTINAMQTHDMYRIYRAGMYRNSKQYEDHILKIADMSAILKAHNQPFSGSYQVLTDRIAALELELRQR